MSIPTQALKYGWKVLATLTLGGATIFVADNQMNRITTATRIEIALGVTERCLATQTGTNIDGTPIYAVDPPSIVRTWYDTNGTPITVTNAIEWRDDLSMKQDLDAKIFALIPYYVDTNTVYDGTTNISMLTVTGLFAFLHIGDGTNFTSIPCWTNNVGQTNCTTNAATYGAWAWRNYVVAWQERYKVLNAMRVCVCRVTNITTLLRGANSGQGSTVEQLQQSFATGYAIVTNQLDNDGTYHSVAAFDVRNFTARSGPGMERSRIEVKYSFLPNLTNLVTTAFLVLYPRTSAGYASIFYDNNLVPTNSQTKWVIVASQSSTGTGTFIFGDVSSATPYMACNTNTSAIYGWRVGVNGPSSNLANNPWDYGVGVLVDLQFLYCANKFW